MPCPGFICLVETPLPSAMGRTIRQRPGAVAGFRLLAPDKKWCWAHVRSVAVKLCSLFDRLSPGALPSPATPNIHPPPSVARPSLAHPRAAQRPSMGQGTGRSPMDRTSYVLEGKTYRFSSEALDALVRGRRDGPHKTMRELAGAIHVSLTSVKEWRRGAHAPSDIAKVEDIARFFHTQMETLLREEATAMTKLNDIQLMAFWRVHKKIQEFFWLVESTDHLVWNEYNLKGFPPSLVGDVVPSWRWPQSEISLSKLTYGESGIKAPDLHQQLWEGICRALEAEKPLLFSCGLYGDLSDYVEKYVFGYAIDNESYEWLPDPDDIYEAPAYPDKPRPLTRMETIEAEAPKAMAQIMESYGMMG